MADVLSVTPAAPSIRREDYRPPAWLVPDIWLDFDLDAKRTLVRARLEVRRQVAGASLRLDGEGIEPLAVRVDGVETSAWRLEEGALLLDLPGDAHSIETDVAIAPDRNTQLMGLYASGGLLCTQCEAEGFRRITFMADRPDVLARYHVRLVADRDLYPVLLSNGDRVATGDLADGRHFAEWADPFPKPSYLFAAVAGPLVARRDHFLTMTGRPVDLGIWVRPGDLDRTGHAMEALKAAMAFDERAYGREYDLAMFNIVAVDDFNFGAMENKGLNIFNARYVLADPELATDSDYDGVATVVAHEYLHNWSGNRVTCRDWFQLSLKEGFTVFRDQGFSADQGSAALRRIEDVRTLRAVQFPEDAGPLAHPIRPDSYQEISNFYTATIYNKGAEVIRMIHRLLGDARFRAGSDLYFARHDGTAATCEDFVRAMEDGGGADLSRFRLWYEQAGTPRVTARLEQGADGTTRLHLSQQMDPTPGQAVKQPMPIPLATALFGRTTGTRLDERLVLLDAAEMAVELPRSGEKLALSINRGFSAPVLLDVVRADGELAFLAAHDDDPFARYEAIQGLTLAAMVEGLASGEAEAAEQAAVAAIARTLADAAQDPAFVAEAVLLPAESFVGDQMLVVDPAAIHAVREAMRARIGRGLAADWRRLEADGVDRPFAYTPAEKGRRRLRGIALGYLVAGGADDVAALALSRYRSADNMTDRLAALGALAAIEGAERDEALADFHRRFRQVPLVLDKWFAVQATAPAATAERVRQLLRHADFSLANPNRVRALLGSFAANQRAFHASDGDGYDLLADVVIALDPLNAQTAARLVPPLGRWRRFDEPRARTMRAALQRILAAPGLSRDVMEQASKSLG